MPLDPQLFIFRSEAVGTHFVGGHGLTVGGFHCKVMGDGIPDINVFVLLYLFLFHTSVFLI